MCHKSSIFLAPLRGGSAPTWTFLAEGGKKKEPRGALFLHQCAKTAFFIFLYTAFAVSGRTRPAAV